jgi:hypothetical protein
VAAPRRSTLRKAADSTGPERRLARVINQSTQELTFQALTDDAIDAARAGNLADFINWDPVIQKLGDTAPILESAVGKAAIAEAGKIDAHLSLNTVDAMSQRYGQEEAGKLIRNITETQRATIRDVLGQSLGGGMTKDQAARQIRQHIGLHPAWAQAVRNFEAKQLATVPKGYSPERWRQTVQRRTDAYYNRLLRRRADNIARTEIITAENLGRYGTWADSIGRGLNGVDSRKEWSPGPGACRACQRRVGETVLWNQPFSGGLMMPPAHPSCRCTANLLPAPYENPALRPRTIDWLSPTGDHYEIDFDPFTAGFDLLDNIPARLPAPATAVDDAIPDMPEARVKATKADELTYDSTLHWSDEKLMQQMARYADDDPEAMDKLLDIIDQRAAVQAEREAAEARLVQSIREQDKRDAEIRRYAQDNDPSTNPAAKPERALTQTERIREEYSQYIGAQINRALDDLNGVFFNNKMLSTARAKGITEEQLFTGSYNIAQKYASEELKEWWLQNGRETLGSFRYRIAQQPSDYKHALRVKNLGHSSGQARSQREYGL